MAFGGGELRVGVERCVLYMDSRVLQRAIVAVCEGTEGKASRLPTRSMSTI
jgi:hypothetical protein